MRVEAMPRRRPSMWPNDVANARGGYFRTRAGVRRGMPWMNPEVNEGAEESGKGRGTERAMPIGHEASAGKRLKREEGRVGQGGR